MISRLLNWGTTYVWVGPAELVVLEVVGRMVVLGLVVIVDETLLRVVDGLTEVVPEDAGPPHPTRLDPIATSSNQTVLTSPL
jgi:hypothetical protein